MVCLNSGRQSPRQIVRVSYISFRRASPHWHRFSVATQCCDLPEAEKTASNARVGELGPFNRKKGQYSKPKFTDRNHEYADIRGQKPTATPSPGKQLMTWVRLVRREGKETLVTMWLQQARHCFDTTFHH